MFTDDIFCLFNLATITLYLFILHFFRNMIVLTFPEDKLILTAASSGDRVGLIIMSEAYC